MKALRVWAEEREQLEWNISSLVSAHIETRKKCWTGGGTEEGKRSLEAGGRGAITTEDIYWTARKSRFLKTKIK